jgi:hypothetical protein
MEIRDDMVERGGIVADREGTLFRVLIVDDQIVWMNKFRPKSATGVIHTRSLTWEEFRRFGYELKFP